MIKLNEWIVVGDVEIWFSIFAEDKCSFKTKAEAINDVSCSKIDARKTPKVKRISTGEYVYSPKDCDTGTFGESFQIIKITETNLAYYNTLRQETLEQEDKQVSED